MEGLYTIVVFFFAGTGCVLGNHISLNISEPMPDSGTTQVELVCTYRIEAPNEVRRVYIDKFGGQHDGWKNIAEFNVEAGTKEFVGMGQDLSSRAELTTGEGTMTLTFNSIGCDDTGRYKCDVSEGIDRTIRNIGELPLDVQEKGKTCSGASSIAFNVFALVCIVISVFMRS